MSEVTSQNPLEGRPTLRIGVGELLLDPDNPRFGLQGRSASQEQILDLIVEKFGVNDVLSSLAVNGYFEAEPMVCRKISSSDQSIVVEGNRRLAACLIILGERRAANQATRTAEYSALWNENGRPAIEPVPCILFEDAEQETKILSYLGVRHIAASQPWDSYAKAVWVAQVVEGRGLDIQTVSKMIGDQHRTINRLLEGYYLVQQLIDEGRFNPQDSVRRGRGSVTDYPFSWVYTVLGYATVRSFLSLGDGGAQPEPLAAERLGSGGLLLRAMFGDKSSGRNAAVGDSRQLGLLASALASQEKVRLLEQGKTLADIEVLTQPIEERLSEGLGFIRDTLRDLIARVSEQEIDVEVAEGALPTSTGNRRMSADLDRKLKEIVFGDDDDGD